MEKINELVMAILADAKEIAIREIAEAMIERSPNFWAELKAHGRKQEAALAVMCLLQEAVEDGAICAARSTKNEEVPLRVSVIDGGCTMIEMGDTDGVVLEVVECNYRIALTDPDGNRGYLERMLSHNVPCVGGSDIESAGIFREARAAELVKSIKRDWLSVYVAVELEPLKP